MGFFKDFKRDFAQAVNELMPDKDEQGNEYDDEDMVNTFDDNDNMEIAPEDMMDDLEDFLLEVNTFDEVASNEDNNGERIEGNREYDEEKSEFENIPSAEIIMDNSQADIKDLEGNPEQERQLISELIGNKFSESGAGTDYESDMEGSYMDGKYMSSVVDSETEGNDTEADISDVIDGDSDELRNLDNLDEEDMSENIADALSVEPDTEVKNEVENKEAAASMPDIDKAVLDAMQKREEALAVDSEETIENANDWEDSMADIETKIIEEQNGQESNIDSILSDDTTYITKGTTIKGNIETEGGIDIIGSVEGDVTCGGKLILGGILKGNVTAGQVYANAAKIEGEVQSEGSVKIGVGSVVVGNISSTSAVIAGAVNGDIDVHGPVIVDSTAVIMGNIKSRSVQINNGAVIEGFCSQCYSEIDVKSFFDLDDDKEAKKEEQKEDQKEEKKNSK